METKKKYTLAQCKRDMISLWSWMAKTGSANKEEYLHFLFKHRAASTYERFSNMVFHCPCCTYTGHDKEYSGWCKACKDCPITWKNKYTNGYNAICALPDSEFYNWENSYDKDARKERANIILELAKAIQVK